MCFASTPASGARCRPKDDALEDAGSFVLSGSVQWIGAVGLHLQDGLLAKEEEEGR
jgi:hypothetical protein